MKKQFLTLYLLAMSTLVFSQDSGSLEYLDNKHGFKTISLGSDITSFKGKIKLLQKGKDSTYMYDYIDKSDFKVSNYGITEITLNTFKGKIMNIFVQFEKGSGEELYSVFGKAYGMYSEKPNRFMNKYNWIGKTITFRFYFESGNPLAWFSDNKIRQEHASYIADRDKAAISEL